MTTGAPDVPSALGADHGTRDCWRRAHGNGTRHCSGESLHWRSAPKCRFSATHSIKAIRVVIAPVTFRTVVHGVARMSGMARIGRVALKAIIYFEVLTTIALIIGLVMVNVLKPGVGMNVDPSKVDTSSAQS
jgi:Na+/H+-dicarboxylate symporter